MEHPEQKKNVLMSSGKARTEEKCTNVFWKSQNRRKMY
jgi:hypothetical protein